MRRPGIRVRVEPLAELEHLVGRRRRADLEAERVVHAREELHVSAVRLARALPDPEHVGGAVVPVAGRGVAARQRLLVVEHEALVARPDVHLVELGLGREVDPAGGHEAQRALDLGGELLVAAALRRRGDELLVPLVHAHEVGEAALRERAQEVERRGGVVVRLHHAIRVGDPRLGVRGVVVDHVAAEGRDLLAADLLRRRRPRLGELPGDAPDLHDRERGAVREHGRHLEHDLQLLADVDGREVVERLGAFARLEQERAALGGLGEHGAQLARLAGENERRHDRKPGPRGFGPLLARPLRLVERLMRPPRGGRPGSLGNCHRNSV